MSERERSPINNITITSHSSSSPSGGGGGGINNHNNNQQHSSSNSSSQQTSSPSSSSPQQPQSQQQPQQQQPQQQTPLPKHIFVPLILTLFMESISYVTPMPFMGNYISHLTNHPIVESGRYSGIIVGCFYGGTILSGSWWGRISDQFGRKPVILFGMFMSACLELLFGLAPNIWICFFVRLLQGLFNGMQATSKTVIAESTDSTNESLGFSLMSLAWSGGTFIGMANGGWLYGVGDPHFYGLSFPAFLPCATMAMFGFCCVFVVWWKLPETNPRTIPLTWTALKEFLSNGGIVTSQKHAHHHSRSNSNEVLILTSTTTKGDPNNGDSKHRNISGGNSVAQIGVITVPSSSNNNGISINSITSSTINANTVGNNINNNNNNNNLLNNNGNNNINNSNKLDTTDTDSKTGKSKEANDFTFARMWQIPLLKAAMVDYLLLSSHEIAFDEVFPLLAVSPDSVAGLAMTVSEVGLTIMYAGFFMIVSVYAFPIIRRWYGDMVYVYGSFVLAICYIGIPQGELGVQGGNHRFYALAMLIPLRTWANDFCYSQALLMIPRSAPVEHVGTVTAMSTSAAAVVRLLIPPIASAVFSFSVTGFVWMYPHNSTLTFALCSILAICGAVHRRNWIMKGMVTTGSRPTSLDQMSSSSNNNNGGQTINGSNSGNNLEGTSMV